MLFGVVTGVPVQRSLGSAHRAQLLPARRNRRRCRALGAAVQRLRHRGRQAEVHGLEHSPRHCGRGGRPRQRQAGMQLCSILRVALLPAHRRPVQTCHTLHPAGRGTKAVECWAVRPVTQHDSQHPGLGGSPEKCCQATQHCRRWTLD